MHAVPYLQADEWLHPSLAPFPRSHCLSLCFCISFDTIFFFFYALRECTDLAGFSSLSVCLSAIMISSSKLKSVDFYREDHGHHDHESYYGDLDTETLVATMDALVAPVPLESRKLVLEDKSGKKDDVKRPAPLTGGCRIEGFLRVKKVPGNLVISACSGAHSFDASQMNMSHVIYHLSFGKKITPRAMSEIKRLTPYLGASIDRLNGREYITNKDVATANVTAVVHFGNIYEYSWTLLKCHHQSKGPESSHLKEYQMIISVMHPICVSGK